ncbi:MAG: nucleotidyltransferase domain-containing protein [Candidatus Jordarchaeum sp.]|uniref:nucleotidyltransferase domain-containing protein n=1 Tax=Candidatus Jordarchaeum sp. TaxID=2823881 RepID=UPI00404929D8
MRKEKDRDYIRTIENLFFCIVGYTHPPDRILAYLKYMPNPEGKWGHKQRFKRMLQQYDAKSVTEGFRLLREIYPNYLYYDSINNITFSAVPLKSIAKKYRPEEKVKELIAQKDLDPLENKAVSLVKTLSNQSGVPIEKYGITGSILINIHNPDFSDIDLTVYGRENSQATREAILELKRKKVLHSFEEKEAEQWIKKKEGMFQLNSKQAKLLLERKWNIGFYEKTRFSIHPIREDSEIEEEYGSRKYKPKGFSLIEATVKSADNSIYLPCNYHITDIKILEGEKVENIDEITSYEGIFCHFAEKGERIRSRGKLEEVITRSGRRYHRILVGSSEAQAKDFIHIIK